MEGGPEVFFGPFLADVRVDSLGVLPLMRLPRCSIQVSQMLLRFPAFSIISRKAPVKGFFSLNRRFRAIMRNSFQSSGRWQEGIQTRWLYRHFSWARWSFA